MNIEVDGSLLPHCIKCDRIMIRPGFPRALRWAIADTVGEEGVTFESDFSEHYCIYCYTPPGWHPLEPVEGERVLPQPNIPVQIAETLYGYQIGMRLGNQFLAFDHTSGVLTIECAITHWRYLDLEVYGD